MSNKLRLIFLLFFFVFGLTNINFAEDKSSLAKFIIRNYESNEIPRVGSTDPDHVIVEFFDYRCGYCSKQAFDYAKLLETHDNVQIVYIEFPIFGGISEDASKIAMEVWQQNPELYFKVHNDFMKLGSKMKKNDLINILNLNGLNGNLMYSIMEEKDYEIIDTNTELARSLGLRGTPASIINDTIIPGYVKLINLKEIITQ